MTSLRILAIKLMTITLIHENCHRFTFKSSLMSSSSVFKNNRFEVFNEVIYLNNRSNEILIVTGPGICFNTSE